MGVTVFNDKYVRVTRAWNKQETQIYVPIKKSLQAALKEAKQIDRKLLEQQNEFLAGQEQSGDRYFHEDGSIVGLRIVTRHRDGRKPSNEITLRIKVPNRDKPFFSNVSLDKHGFEQAFALAIDKICEWNKIDGKSPVRARLLAAASAHRAEATGKKAPARKAAKPAKAAAKPVKAAKPAAKKTAKPVKAAKPAKAAAKPAKAAKAAKPAAKKAAKPVKAVSKKPAAKKPAKAAAKPAKATKPAAKKAAKAPAKAKKGKGNK